MRRLLTIAVFVAALPVAAYDVYQWAIGAPASFRVWAFAVLYTVVVWFRAGAELFGQHDGLERS
jgi:ABC-type Na+ efflux pump permease subunit